MHLDILIIETYPLKPHLETAGEIALSYHDKNKVQVCYMGADLAWNEYVESNLHKWLLGGMKVRIAKFARILRNQGVDILDAPRLSTSKTRDIMRWADDFPPELAKLRSYSFDDASLGLGVASSLISKYRDPDIPLRKIRSEVKKALVSACVTYERTLMLLDDYEPSKVVTFNGRLANSYPIVKAAERRGVPVVFHERGANYTRYELFHGSVHSMKALRERIEASWAAGASDEQRTHKGRLFFEKRRGGEGLGWISFTKGQVANLIPPKDGRRRVVYFSSSDDEWAAIEDGAVHKFEPRGQKAAVTRLINVCRKLPNLELIIRIHPNVGHAAEHEVNWWRALGTESIKVIDPTDPVDSYALADSADVVCVFGSTMGVEAAYWGTPSILLADSGYSGLDCCFEPTNDEELVALLLNPPKTWSKEGCIKYGYHMFTFGRKYEFYEPKGLFEGSFLGDELSPRHAIGEIALKCYQGTKRLIR